LALVLSQAGARPGEVQAQVEAFLSCLGADAIAPDAQWVAVEGESLAAAAICADSPGRTSLVFIPAMRLHPRHKGVVVELLRHLVEAGRQRGIRLFQAMVPVGANDDAYTVAAAGFNPLAELIYLQRLSTLPVPPHEESDGLTWTCYDGMRHPLFAEVIQATYAESLDCPRLAGMREIEDIITGHKAVGEFDPGKWFVVHLLGQAVGCLLLARLPRRSSMELVYMGLRPEARRKSVGKAMLARAVQLAKASRLAHVTLAVDALNTPARTLYQRFGFFETMRRAAWVLT
jgi:GNAT superfamily N-acetyltransferase